MLTLGSEKHVVSYCVMCSLAFSVRFSSEIPTANLNSCDIIVISEKYE